MSKKNKGLGLLEVVIIVAIIMILASAILVFLNSAKRIGQAQDAQRWSDVRSILKAVYAYALDNESISCGSTGFPLESNDNWRCIGPGVGTEEIIDPGDATVQVCHIRETCVDDDACKKPAYLDTEQECCCESLKDWNSNRNRELDALYEIEVARIEGIWHNPETITSQININGWDTNDDYYIKIYTTPEARHQGKWDNTAYRLICNKLNSGSCLYVNDHVEIDGLQIKVIAEANQSITGIEYPGAASDSDIFVSNNIINGIMSNPENSSWGLSISFKKMLIWNNIVYGFNNDNDYGIGVYSNNSEAKGYLYNNTVYDCDTGVHAVGQSGINIYIRNSVSFQNTSDDFDVKLTEKDHCACDNNDDCDINPASWDDVFVDYQNYDFHLKSTDTDLKDQGVDLSEYFTDDIDGGHRNLNIGGAWDIGADEAGIGVCCDLDEELVQNGYLNKTPLDPTESDLENTGNSGYYIRRRPSGEVWVWAPHISDYYQGEEIIVAE